jgi:hypothetical protein
MARPLNRPYELPLMFCARSGDSLGNDLALFRNETVQFLFILIVDVDFFSIAETASTFFSYRIGIALFTAVVSSASILALMKHV